MVEMPSKLHEPPGEWLNKMINRAIAYGIVPRTWYQMIYIVISQSLFPISPFLNRYFKLSRFTSLQELHWRVHKLSQSGQPNPHPGVSGIILGHIGGLKNY